LDFLENGLSVSGTTESEIFLFVAVISQMGQDVCDDSLKDCSVTTQQFFTILWRNNEM
jgi:hypothetical protein